jgi:hypothetical protein
MFSETQHDKTLPVRLKYVSVRTSLFSSNFFGSYYGLEVCLNDVTRKTLTACCERSVASPNTR